MGIAYGECASTKSSNLAAAVAALITVGNTTSVKGSACQKAGANLPKCFLTWQMKESKVAKALQNMLAGQSLCHHL